MFKRASIVAAVAIALTATSAGASTVTRDPSGAVVLTAAPGESNKVYLGPGWDADGESVPGFARITDSQPITVDAEGCALRAGEDRFVNCRVDPAGVRLALGDGNDSSSVSFDFDASVLVSVDGGAGEDTLTGGAEPDTLDGGDGEDSVDGRAGPDTVRGGAGDDQLFGDHFEDAAADVIDGGPGVDTMKEDWTSRYSDAKPDVSVTLGAGADDGRPGEGDDVRGIETVITHQGGSLTGTDAAEHLQAFETTTAVRIAGAGGDDELRAGGGDDTVDGGAGGDMIDAGYGNDVITGGPGRDVVFADLAGGDCGPLWCTYPYGNDTVDVRDGEADSVTCGAGTDRVIADAIDVVAPDCETVERPAGSAPASKRCTVPKVTGLKTAAAKRKLAAAGCRARTKGHGPHVRRQSVRAGKRVARNTVITLALGR